MAHRLQRHDIEAVLAHFTDDVVSTSPVAARVVPASGGVIRGNADLRGYWTSALERVADLRFELVGVHAGVDTVMIQLPHQRGGLVGAVMTFADGLVVTGPGTYRTPSRP